MKTTTLAVYERKSTLWKNANALYVAQDWTKMECLFIDYTEEKESNKSIGLTVINKLTGEDITEQWERETYKPYVVRLTNRRRTNSKDWSFETKQEANMFYKVVTNNKHLQGWKKVA